MKKGGALLETRFFSVELDDTGRFNSLMNKSTDRQYLPTTAAAPLLTLKIAGKDMPPRRLEWLVAERALRLHFAPEVTADISLAAKSTHIVFELSAVNSARPVELASWGPWPTTIGETIGETVGVVRDRDFAIGIQALNAKTLGGRPLTDDDVMPSYDIFDSGDYADVSLEFRDRQLYRGDTAVSTEFGSALQAYCRDRSRQRVIRNWGHESYVAPAHDDGGVVGAKVALFGCPTSRIMPTLEAIELEEGLPHPTIQGQWAKTSRQATASYLIMDFGEDTIDRAIAATRVAGLEYLYHSSPFETWGHFRLKADQFPHGWDGFKNCVAQAATAGVKIGFHTLSNFTTPNDPYVTPVPDPRLARIGGAQLAKAINQQVRTIGIDEPTFFRQQTTLNAVVIGDEIITYKRLSTSAPWKLLGCVRGAFGTTAAAHSTGADVGKLMDHGYRVFLSDASLAREQARRIAAFCNHTGALQLSFDGLEGNWSTGMGQYGRTLFTQAWYEGLDPALRGTIINDASNPGHFNWHIYTRMNWGEPWYAGFRESQTLYRLKNQYYYSRNLMPRMLGWFALRGDTSLEDAEWLLARAAGFDAGFSLATDMLFAGDQILPGHEVASRGPQSNLQALLATVRRWETARMGDAFPDRLKAQLQDIEREFHLEGDAGGWQLFPVHSVNAKLHGGRRTIAFDNPHAQQPLTAIVQNVGKKAVAELVLVLADRRLTLCHRPLEPGEKLKVGTDGQLTRYDENWGLLDRTNLEEVSIVVSGLQKIRLDWSAREPGQALRAEYRTLGKPVLLEPTTKA
ncbi:MAG: hypothetical protein GKR89_37765 [Candidatus Latescibacteria bacterium]|nr:hypothetical protein [Candidatus Latescibacterota bacterium]